jgi:hypothetical protein
MSTNNDKNDGDTPSNGRERLPPPPPPAKYLHQKSQELTLILRKVEMSEIVRYFPISS